MSTQHNACQHYYITSWVDNDILMKRSHRSKVQVIWKKIPNGYITMREHTCARLHLSWKHFFIFNKKLRVGVVAWKCIRKSENKSTLQVSDWINRISGNYFKQMGPHRSVWNNYSLLTCTSHFSILTYTHRSLMFLSMVIGKPHLFAW